jgi:hypothetical protein
MYRNYYLFRRQTEFLNRSLSGHTILKCFTHRKDELVISMLNPAQENVFLRIGLQIQLPYLLLYTGYPVKDPQTDFFPELAGLTPGPFSIIPFDKLIRAPVERYTLEMFFYGHHPNILLKDQTDTVCAGFKKRVTNGEDKKHDLYVDPSSFQSPQFLELATQGGDHGLIDFFNHHFGGFNTLLSRELSHRCDVAPDKKVKDLTSCEMDRIRETCRTMITEMEEQPVKIYFDQQQPVHISLLTLHHLGKDAEHQVY